VDEVEAFVRTDSNIANFSREPWNPDLPVKWKASIASNAKIHSRLNDRQLKLSAAMSKYS